MKTRTLAMLLCTLALAPLGAEETKPAPDGAKKPGGPGGQGGPGGKGDGSFFRNMDKDGDKAISEAEAGERWQGLGKLDKDSDGKVTMQELMAGRPGVRMAQVPVRASPGKDPVRDAARVPPVSSSRTPTRTATARSPRTKCPRKRGSASASSTRTATAP